MKLPPKLEEMCGQLRAHPDITEAQAVAMRMACEVGYMFGLTEAHAAAKADPSLKRLDAVISAAAIGSLDTMRSLFEDLSKGQAPS